MSPSQEHSCMCLFLRAHCHALQDNGLMEIVLSTWLCFCVPTLWHQVCVKKKVTDVALFCMVCKEKNLWTLIPCSLPFYNTVNPIENENKLKSSNNVFNVVWWMILCVSMDALLMRYSWKSDLLNPLCLQNFWLYIPDTL